jgi:myo-inositol catabolism protein IolC
VVSVEKSGQEEFEFVYGEDFAQHIEAFHPTFAKVLVRYNPEGEVALNQRQVSRLKRLSDSLHRTQRLFMFELQVPASPMQLEQVEGDKNAYDLQLRPRLMMQVIQALQDAGVEPDVWKVEGLDRQEDGVKIVEMARRDASPKRRPPHTLHTILKHGSASLRKPEAHKRLRLKKVRRRLLAWNLPG